MGSEDQDGFWDEAAPPAAPGGTADGEGSSAPAGLELLGEGAPFDPDRAPSGAVVGVTSDVTNLGPLGCGFIGPVIVRAQSDVLEITGRWGRDAYPPAYRWANRILVFLFFTPIVVALLRGERTMADSTALMLLAYWSLLIAAWAAWQHWLKRKLIATGPVARVRVSRDRVRDLASDPSTAEVFRSSQLGPWLTRRLMLVGSKTGRVELVLPLGPDESPSLMRLQMPREPDAELLRSWIVHQR